MAGGEACDECKSKCLLLHQRKKDPSPLITTFYKVLYGGYDYWKYLCLPQKISQTIPVLGAGKVYDLEDTNGQRWQVTLGNKDGHLAFNKGWDKFYADHGLREGYSLVFHFMVKSHFVVQIIDKTGLEKRMFPLENGKKRKRSEIDVNSNAVGECQNHSNKQGSVFPGVPDSEARIHGQPMSKNNSSSVKPGDGMYQHVALGDSDIEQVFTINRDSGYKCEEGRSPILGFINLEMRGVDPDGSSDKRTHPSNTSAACNAAARILDENPVSAKVVSGEPPAKVTAPTFFSNSNVSLKKENVAEVGNDHLGDYQSGLGKQSAKNVAELPAKATAPTFSNNNNLYLKRENMAEVGNDRETVTLLKSERMEVGKSPSCEFMSVEKYPKFKERSDQIIGGDEKSNEIHKAVKAEPVDSYNDERLDASALTFTVMVGSKELLVLTLWTCMDKKVVNLKGGDKRVWPVLYHQKLGIKALTSGWKNFFLSNKLRIGDECTFILENESETIFRIDVKR
ncbi:hypothetical protein DCAR_0206288 [Daucus carota subsp. sativus]|uniref:TF-B3 domain-containing protein n=1 Tax=Daucus carota subsp. sativus TaxID=79200 RepID=A0AAF0WF91_DAUCS|nr:hypothetical protein DCAR_0206288 [Daucus carota subsp. sativus]